MMKSCKFLYPLIIPICLFIFWFGLSMTNAVPEYLLPSPSDLFDGFYTYVLKSGHASPYAGRFLVDLSASTSRVCAGFLIAVITGIPLGLLSGKSRLFRSLFSASVNGLRAVPGISLLPLALVWFGIGFKTTVFLISLAAFFPIYISTASGVRQVPEPLMRSGAMMNITGISALFKITLPAAMPHIVSGLRLGLGLSWAYLVLGELTGVENGLGAVIMDARMAGRIDIIIIGIICIALAGRASDLFLVYGLKTGFKGMRLVS